MKKLFIISIAILFGSSNFVMAETSAVKCFEMGFTAASKAYHAGDKSAFTPVYGMSPKMMKASPCCNIGTEPSCLGYNGAYHCLNGLKLYFLLNFHQCSTLKYP